MRRIECLRCGDAEVGPWVFTGPGEYLCEGCWESTSTE